MDGTESRRSARIAGGFWVAVEGVDAELMLRRGDISATGIYFEIDGDVGSVGTVQWLHVASLDRTRIVHVMAHVVRVVSLADVHREVKGVALEFMPESDEAAAHLCELVRHVLEAPQRDGATAQIATRMQARAQDDRAADVSELSVKTLVLEADWSVPVGEPVRVEIIARGVRRPIRLEGQAVSVLPAVRAGSGKEKRFRIAVQMKEALKGPLRRFSEAEIAIDPVALERAKAKMAEKSAESPIDQLLSALIQPPAEPPERKHLAGELSRIPFSSLCSLLALERLSGELSIRREDDLVRLFVQDGRFVDLESARETDARAEIGRLLASREGTFAFLVTPVLREDRIGASMNELLLDAAAREDESIAARP